MDGRRSDSIKTPPFTRPKPCLTPALRQTLPGKNFFQGSHYEKRRQRRRIPVFSPFRPRHGKNFPFTNQRKHFLFTCRMNINFCMKPLQLNFMELFCRLVQQQGKRASGRNRDPRAAFRRRRQNLVGCGIDRKGPRRKTAVLSSRFRHLRRSALSSHKHDGFRGSHAFPRPLLF